MPRRRYTTPPLVEAACDFRFDPGSPWSITVPGQLYTRLKSTFPVQRPVVGLEATLTAEPGSIRQQFSPVDSIRFVKKDESAVVQVNPNNVIISHVRPYYGWPKFKPLILRVLDAYRGVANPAGFQRIGLRYINRIDFARADFPGGRLEPRDYFDYYPLVGPRLPQDYHDFHIGTEFPFDDERNVLRLQLSVGQTIGLDPMAFLLDLDYFSNAPDSVSFLTVKKWLETAHERIEDVFEGCIKDPLRQRFEEEVGA